MKRLLLVGWVTALLACNAPTQPEPDLTHYILSSGTVDLMVDAFDTTCYRLGECPGAIDTAVLGDFTLISSFYQVEGARVEITPFTHPDSSNDVTVLSTDSSGHVSFTSDRFAVPVFSDGTKGSKKLTIRISASGLRTNTFRNYPFRKADDALRMNVILYSW